MERDLSSYAVLGYTRTVENCECFIGRCMGNKISLIYTVIYNAKYLACEQALHLGLTRDLFWARGASGRERIGTGAS